MNRRMLCCGTVVAVEILALALPALADEESDRVKEAESYLSRMSDKLSGIGGKSSSNDIDESIRDADRVKEQANKLRSLNAQNDPGKTMANSYPDWVNKFQESARYLRQMKDAQLKANDARLTERCNDANLAQRRMINDFVDKKDRKGVSQIQNEAENLGRIYGDELKKMEETHREMERWKGYSRSFSESHGKWSDVRSQLNDGANDIWDKWSRRMEESRYKCQDIAKGKDNPAVVEALGKLGSHNKQMEDIYKEVRSDFYRWRTDLNSFRTAALQDAREIKDLFCSDLDWERRVQAVADKYASELRGKWDRLTSDRDRMLNRCDLLISMGSENAPKLKRMIVQAYDRMEPVKNGELQGSNHPKIRAHIEKGKSEHNSRQSGCDMKETPIDSSWCKNPHPDRRDCRLDCVKGCTIIEIKPNNSGEIKMGGEQVLAYKNAFEKMWDQKKEEMFTMDSGRYAHLKRCVSSSTFRVEMFVETYGFCPDDPNVFFGTREAIPTDDPPERPND